MNGRRSSHEIWREHARSVVFLLERAETEGGRASGAFGRVQERLTGSATVMALVCRRCDVAKSHHTGRDHEFMAQPSGRIAYRFSWTSAMGDRGEIDLDSSKSPVWKDDRLR